MLQSAPSAAPALHVDHLTKSYGGLTAVDNLSFAVFPGEIVGLLGLNGAGKSTTINMILGVLEPSSGSVSLNGFTVATRREQALAKTNFAAVYAPLPGNLTVRQNLRIFGLIYNVPRLEARIETLLAQYELAGFAETRCGLLSSGEQSRVSLAKAMLNAPSVLLLDEPTASIDPSTAQGIRNYIRDYAREQHGAVLWTSHNMYEVEEVCDRILLLSHGKILLEGDPKTLPQAHGFETLEALFVSVARDVVEASR